MCVAPYVLNTIQASREAARRKEMRGGRDPAEDFKMLIATRELYPIVPLGKRLHGQSKTDHLSDTGRSSKVSSEAEQLLVEYEKESQQKVRRYRLSRLHDDTFAEFVQRNGFGIGTGKNGKVTQNWSQILADSPLHPLSVGHTEHAMTGEIKDEFGRILAEWRISKLELVSLLKFPEPRVYLSRNLPNMKELNGAPTRPLDTFEKAGLHRIREGEDIVIESDIDEIRMIGAVPAAWQCVACHSVRRGDLLGAFSYSLHRTPPLAAAEH